MAQALMAQTTSATLMKHVSAAHVTVVEVVAVSAVR